MSVQERDDDTVVDGFEIDDGTGFVIHDKRNEYAWLEARNEDSYWEVELL